MNIEYRPRNDERRSVDCRASLAMTASIKNRAIFNQKCRQKFAGSVERVGYGGQVKADSMKAKGKAQHAKQQRCLDREFGGLYNDLLLSILKEKEKV